MQILTDIGALVVVATGVALVGKWLRQPLIAAYLITGVLLGKRASGIILDHTVIDALAQVGVVFLLFSVGMELDWRKFAHLRARPAIAAILQIGITATLGFWIARLLGFAVTDSVYTAAALSFASTILIVAALDRTRELDTLHGRLLLAIMFIQDVIAIGVLIALSGMSHGVSVHAITTLATQVFLNGTFLIALTWLAATLLLPPLFRSIHDAPELALLVALGWAFLFTGLSAYLGLSIEIGALLGGVSLATLPQSLHLRLKIRPIRDFFMLIFFASLGLQFSSTTGAVAWGAVGALSLFVLIGHPLVLYIVVRGLGYRPRTGFLAAIPTAQVSEFSLILGSLGVSLGQLNATVATSLIGVSIITFLASSYLVSWSHSLYSMLKPVLGRVNKVKNHATALPSIFADLTDHTIIVGSRHIGHVLVRAAQRNRTEVVVVDLDPAMIEDLTEQHIPALVGDATEEEVLETVNIEKATQLVSTVSEVDINAELIRVAKSINHSIRIIVLARSTNDALALYTAGADYVAITHHISGDVLVRFLNDVAAHPAKLRTIRSSHLEELKSDHLDFRLAHHHVGERSS